MAGLRTCSIEELRALLGKPRESKLVLLDVREPGEQSSVAIPGSIRLPYSQLLVEPNALGGDPATPIITFCETGQFSMAAAAHLSQKGFRNVRSLAGGLQGWDRPVHSVDSQLDIDELSRYQRQLGLKEVGVAGQLKLKQARMVIIGGGGLGSPAAIYLTAAGIGTLVLVDSDQVELSNLARQIVHDTAHVGLAKVASARIRLQAINPQVKLVAISERFTETNARAVCQGADLIIDGSDNFETRYLANDISLATKIPLLYGAVEKFQGQLALFQPPLTPCYRCLFLEPPQAALNCAEIGVVGVVPGIIGTLQAAEAIKFILGIGDSLAGKLLTYDALKANFKTLVIQRQKNCPSCRRYSNESSISMSGISSPPEGAGAGLDSGAGASVSEGIGAGLADGAS